MSAPIPSSEPSRFVAGDTQFWTRSIADYSPVDGWALSYVFVGALAVTPPTVTTSGNTYSVTLLATSTVALKAGGLYRLIGLVKKGAERHTVYDQIVTVLPNVETAALTDLQTHAERMLTAIEATLEGRVPADIQQYTIEQRSVMKIPIKELLTLRGFYSAKVWRERNATKSLPSHAVAFAQAGSPVNDPWDGQP